MDARLVLQTKQEALAALKAGQYKEALETLQQATDASPGGKLQDLLLAELLSTLQRKVAQDEAVAADGDDASANSDTGSDGPSTHGDSSSSDHSSEAESDDAQDETVEVPVHAGAATAQQPQQHSPTPTAPSGPLQQEAACPGSSTHAGDSCHASLQESVLEGSHKQQQQEMHTGDDPDAVGSPCYETDSQDECAEEGGAPALYGIQLAAGSCSLSHSERAHLRQQLAVGIEEQKTAAALEKALANDPLLSMSLG